MKAALTRFGVALRAFARGFLGLAAPPPQESRALHQHFDEKARGRTPCC